MRQHADYKQKKWYLCAMFLRIRMFLVWLRRIDKCQGFGVQSPSAYRFIRQVINCHTLYPAYSVLEEAQKLNRVERKLGRLFYRLSCEVGQATWYMLPQTPCLPYYIRCVEQANHLSDVGGARELQAEGRRVLLVDGGTAQAAAVDAFMADAREGDLLVMLDIRAHRSNHSEWLRWAADRRCSVGFDLYYCGILFFDKRFKQTYVVNF